jgi:hypothetical protein
MKDEATKEALADLGVMLDRWRWKVRHVTFALVCVVIGLIAAPLAFFGVFLPFGQLLASAIIAGGASTVAAPVAWWVAKLAVPRGRPDAPAGGPPELEEPTEATLEQAKEIIITEALNELVHQAGVGAAMQQYAWACVVLTKVGPWGAMIVGLSAAVLGVASAAPIPGSLGMLLTGPAMAVLALSFAMRHQLPLLLDPPRGFEKLEAPKVDKKVEKDASRPRGRDILDMLRESPMYRRQDVAERELAERPRSKADGLDLLRQRYPLLSASLLARTGIHQLTSGQTKAVASVLAADGNPAMRGKRDFVFFGWSGSGRSTLCNLLTVAAMTHREGAVHCISPESPERSVSQRPGATGSHSTRHPVGQLRTWLDGTRHGRKIQEAYADRDRSVLRLTEGPDVVYTDVRLLADEILGKATGDARGFIERLRYVIVDHPNRLPREDLVRLRIALSRLRLTAELFGRELTFIVMLPRLNNFQIFAKWLLNNDDVEFEPFGSWFGPALVLGWLPPHELVDSTRYTDQPLFARAEFTSEIIALLTELGVQAHHLRKDGQRPLRIAVIDAQPILGPELRSQLGELVLDRLKQEDSFTELPEVLEDWRYYGTHDLAVDRSRCFDVIVCAGVGPHPEHLVASLRAALEDDGLIVLMGDSSTTDQESIRALQEPGWDPLDSLRKARYPSVVLPEHSEAVIAHELASMFGDFAVTAVPRERLAGVFPGEHTEALIEGWIGEGILTVMEAFEARQIDTTPERAPYLRQTEHSPLTGGRYEVPWGCCSRNVYTIYDRTSGSTSRRVGRSLATYVDRDRIFIDFFLRSRLRFPPNTVEVVDLEESQLSAKQRELSRERWVSHGSLVVAQVDYSSGITIDRRAARYGTELLFERPFPRPRSQVLPEGILPELDCKPVAGTLRTLGSEATVEERQAGALRRRRGIAAESQRPAAPMGRQAPVLGLVGGSWICRVRESLRDVVFTGPRLVEDHELVSSVQLPPRLRAQLHRELECTATTLAFELTDQARIILSKEPEAGENPPLLDRALLGDYPAHHALARTLRLYLSRHFIGFDHEYRLAVVPAESPPAYALTWYPGPTPDMGPTGRYAEYQPEPLLPLVLGLVQQRRTERTPLPERVDDICALFDWMHANIRYERDDVLYDRKEYIATPQETLGNGAGDCEDHAILMASMCRVVGMHARTVLLPEHALCEVYLGHKDDLDLDAIEARIEAWQRANARRYGLEGLARPYLQGNLAEGWRRNGTIIERDGEATAGAFELSWAGVYFDIDESGEVWIIADDCCVGSYLGDPTGLVAGAYLDIDEGWQKERSYQHPVPRLSAWRLLIYRLRQDELHPDHHLAPLLNRDLVDKVLPWVIRRLEACDCADGCAACCGGLGTIPSAVWSARDVAPEHFTQADVISRVGAYRLVCALAGRAPNWSEFGRTPTGPHPPGSDPPSDADLRRMVVKIIGAEDLNYRNGLWSEMFGGQMALDPSRIAAASWMSPDDCEAHPQWAGYYQPGANSVHVKHGRSRAEMLATLVHEYTHNWQWTGDFDRQRLSESDQAQQYFDGHLVVEGHARWADHTFRFLEGMGSIYSTTEPGGWNEYKTGYFLMEGIYKAFGEAGLFRWLSKHPDEGDPLRSRDRRLEWPFTLQEALRAFGLEEEALTGRFDGVDVVVERGSGEEQEGSGAGGTGA